MFVAAMDRLFGVTLKAGVAAACVTVMVCEVIPFAKTIIVADLVSISGFAAAVKLIVSLFAPLVELADNHA